MTEAIYVILEASDVQGINFDEVLENSIDTLRYSVDESQVVLKFKGATPDFLEGKTQYTHDDILIIVGTSAWNKPQE